MGFEVPLLSLAAGLASTVAGGVMSANARKQAGQDAAAMADARNRQLQEYRQRMAALEDQSRANNEKTQALYAPDEKAQRDAAANAELQKNYDEATAAPAPLATVPLGGAAPEVTGDAAAKAKEKTDAYTKLLSQRLAALGTQPQALLGSGMALQRAGSRQDMYSNFGKQETALLPQYQDFGSAYWKLKSQGGGNIGGQALTGLGSSLMKYAGSSPSLFG